MNNKVQANIIIIGNKLSYKQAFLWATNFKLSVVINNKYGYEKTYSVTTNIVMRIKNR